MRSLRLFQTLQIAVLLLLLPWAVAQQQGNQGSGTGTGTGGSGTTAPKTPGIPSIVPRSETQLPGLQTVPEILFVAGSVLQVDGMPPPFGTVIELDCGDTVTREATVDYGGRYGFQVGSSNRFDRVMPDASDGMGNDPFDTTVAGTGATAFGTQGSRTRTPLQF